MLPPLEHLPSKLNFRVVDKSELNTSDTIQDSVEFWDSVSNLMGTETELKSYVSGRSKWKFQSILLWVSERAGETAQMTQGGYS